MLNKTWGGYMGIVLKCIKCLLGQHDNYPLAALGNMLGLAAHRRFNNLAQLRFGILKPPFSFHFSYPCLPDRMIFSDCD